MSPAFIQVLLIDRPWFVYMSQLLIYIYIYWILEDFWAVGSLEFEDVDRSRGCLFFSKTNCKVGGFINHFLKSELFFFN